MLDRETRARIDRVTDDPPVHPAHVAVVTAGRDRTVPQPQARDRRPRREVERRQRIDALRRKRVIHAHAPRISVRVASAHDDLAADLQQERQVSALDESLRSHIHAVPLRDR